MDMQDLWELNSMDLASVCIEPLSGGKGGLSNYDYTVRYCPDQESTIGCPWCWFGCISLVILVIVRHILSLSSINLFYDCWLSLLSYYHDFYLYLHNHYYCYHVFSLLPIGSSILWWWSHLIWGRKTLAAWTVHLLVVGPYLEHWFNVWFFQ